MGRSVPGAILGLSPGPSWSHIETLEGCRKRKARKHNGLLRVIPPPRERRGLCRNVLVNVPLISWRTPRKSWRPLGAVLSERSWGPLGRKWKTWDDGAGEEGGDKGKDDGGRRSGWRRGVPPPPPIVAASNATPQQRLPRPPPWSSCPPPPSPSSFSPYPGPLPSLWLMQNQ